MTDPEMQALAQRLDRMERGLRRWRVLGVMGWGVLAASVAFILVILFHVPGESDTPDDGDADSQDVVEDEVKARAFVLVDDEGRPRAALAMRPDGTAALAITGPDGRIVWKAP